jgi:hypothetical protein
VYKYRREEENHHHHQTQFRREKEMKIPLEREKVTVTHTHTSVDSRTDIRGNSRIIFREMWQAEKSEFSSDGGGDSHEV